MCMCACSCQFSLSQTSFFRHHLVISVKLQYPENYCDRRKNATNRCKAAAASLSRMSQLSQSIETKKKKAKQGLTPALFGAVGSKCDVFLVLCSFCFSLGGKKMLIKLVLPEELELSLLEIPKHYCCAKQQPQ